MAETLTVSFDSLSPLRARLMRLRVALIGLARDFWKDTPFPQREKKSPTPKVAKGKTGKAGVVAEEALWSADHIQVMECMWGDGMAFPGGVEYIDLLAKPLGITKELSVLDLSARLGGMGRRIAEEFGAYVTGMEADQMLVSRGMILSIAAGKGKQASIEGYTPETFVPKKKFDCVFARELFFKIEDKDKFSQAVADSVKPGGGQLVFTDYLLDPSATSKPEIMEWLNKEGGALPLSLPETLKRWKDLHFDMRVAEDQTEFYEREILRGLRNLLMVLTEKKPDRHTKLLILQEVDLWAHRLAAFRHGLKYYRFYGIKYKSL